MNAKQKEQYQRLYSLVDARKYVDVYETATELLHDFPEHAELLGFKAFGVYHMPIDELDIVRADFNEAECKMISKPQEVLEVCGMRLLVHAAKIGAGDTHLPAQLLGNKHKALGNYKDALQMFEQIMTIQAWQTNPNFARERAICAIFCGDPKTKEYCIQAEKLADKHVKVFCDNCVQLYSTKTYTEAYFDEARHDIHKVNMELRKKDEFDYEVAEISQLTFYRISLEQDPAIRLSLLDTATEELEDVELEQEMRQNALLELMFADDIFHKEYLDAFEKTVETRLQRNPDESEQVRALIGCLLMRECSNEFVLSHSKQLKRFDTLKIVPDELMEEAVDAVWLLETDAFEKCEICVVMTKEQENAHLEQLVKRHLAINNAQSLNILERLVNVPDHLDFIFELVKSHVRSGSGKLLFCQAFLARYGELNVPEMLSLFRCRRYFDTCGDSVENFDIVLLDKIPLGLEAVPKEFGLKHSYLVEKFVNGRFEEEGQQTYFDENYEAVIQELLLLGNIAQDTDSRCVALGLAARLDFRDRFLNVRFCEFLASNGHEYDALIQYEVFIARNNVFLTAMDVQEMNVLLKLACASPTESIMHYVGSTLDYDEEAKSSEKIPNPRIPLPVPEFTADEEKLVSDEEFCCRVVQLKILLSIFQNLQEQLFDAQELLYIAAYHYQLKNYTDLLNTYNDMLLKRPVIQTALEGFERVIGYFSGIGKEQLHAYETKYRAVFQKIADLFWQHHTMLDSVEYDRLVDYNPFCFDEVREFVDKGKMRVSKKMSKFFARVGFSNEFVQ